VSALIELVPPMRLTDSWVQPLDSAVDVSAFTDATIVVCVTHLERNGLQTEGVPIYLQTSLENYDERYVRLKQLLDLTSNISSQQVYQFTFTGTGETSSETPSTTFPGFGRFLRIEVEMDWSEEAPLLVFDVKALMRAS
jgi:hypothetical protein